MPIASSFFSQNIKHPYNWDFHFPSLLKIKYFCLKHYFPHLILRTCSNKRLLLRVLWYKLFVVSFLLSYSFHCHMSVPKSSPTNNHSFFRTIFKKSWNRHTWFEPPFCGRWREPSYASSRVQIWRCCIMVVLQLLLLASYDWWVS